MFDFNKFYLIDVIDGLKSIDNELFDIILVDPPYNIGKDFGIMKDNLKIDEYIKWCNRWVVECVRVLKNTGTIFIYGFSEILAHISVMLEIQHRWLIWHYTNKTIPKLNFWQRSHESILVGWKDNRIFNLDEIREPYTDIFVKNSAGKIRKNTIGRFSKGNKETVYHAHSNGAMPRDVIKIPALAGGAGNRERIIYCKTCISKIQYKDFKEHKGHNIIIHPTQKPFALTEKLLLSAKPKNNGNVLILFAGSGSEGIVAKKLGMSFIGFDINEDYIEMANFITR